MSIKQVLLRQYDYGCWVRDKLLKLAGELPEDQYFAQHSQRSVHDLLAHTLGTEWLWRNLAQTGTIPGPPPTAESLPTLADVKSAWQQEEADFRAFLDSMTDGELEQTVDTVSPAGDAYTFLRWEMIEHPLLHSMQHRTEVAARLTEYGKSPGDIDFLFFMIARD